MEINLTKESFTTLGDLNFHYLEWAGREPPLLLLHGLASNAHFWDLTVPHLERRFRIVAMDQRGHGSTDKPTKGYDLSTAAKDVARLIRCLSLKRPIIVGHSWGGNVAIQFAADYPDLTSGIVCIDGGFIEPAAAPGATWEQTRLRMAPPDFIALNFTWEELIEQAHTWETATFWGDKLVNFLEANFNVTKDGSVRPNLTRNRHMKILKSIWDQRISEIYHKVSCPVLLIPTWRSQLQNTDGQSSEEWKKASIAKAVDRLARNRLIWMADSIHDVPIQRPGEVADTIIQATEDGFFDIYR
jgi:pimeloyl-ACP methyl ester carboxylesterase